MLQLSKVTTAPLMLTPPPCEQSGNSHSSGALDEMSGKGPRTHPVCFVLVDVALVKGNGAALDVDTSALQNRQM